jgi:hypothetical protein
MDARKMSFPDINGGRNRSWMLFMVQIDSTDCGGDPRLTTWFGKEGIAIRHLHSLQGLWSTQNAIISPTIDFKR